jgi:LAO/AO transport system kinase
MDPKDVLKGDKRAIARLMTLVEDEDHHGMEVLRALHKHTGHAHIVGITGAPGVGKSTLVYRMAKGLRERGERVGIVAVDPSSPFTGGALLGDRIRMMEIATDPEVFIRSMGTRGCLGGLSRKTYEIVKILDAWGADTILVETVGTGQAEVDVVQAVQTCIVVLVSGLGDEVQTFKAGIMEIGDLFVINKADRGGADRLFLEVKAMLDLGSAPGKWDPPIIKTIATSIEGVGQVLDAMKKHYKGSKETGVLGHKCMERAMLDIEDIVRDRMMAGLLTPQKKELMMALCKKVADKKMDPYEAAQKVLCE